MATITDIKTVQRVFCTGDPTAANALGCDLNPGDLVVRTDGGTHYVMTAAGLVLESSMDQSPSFTTVAVSSTATVTSDSAVALAVGLAGATDPAFVVDLSTADQATGISITGAAEAGGVAIAAISSGTNEALTLDAKGSGTVTIGATSTGNVVLGDSLTVTSAGAVSGATTIDADGVVTLTDATDSTSSTTGAVKTAGGLGVAKALNVGTTAGITTSATIGAPGAVALNIGGAAAAATTASELVKVVTAISDNVATAVLTITVPNAAHGALVEVTVVGYAGASGAIGAFECVTGVSYNVAVARTPGVAVGATISSAFGSAAAVVAGAGTMTCTAAVTLTGEGVTVTNTVTVDATINASATADAHRCMVFARILNSQASGITLS